MLFGHQIVVSGCFPVRTHTNNLCSKTAELSFNFDTFYAFWFILFYHAPDARMRQTFHWIPLPFDTRTPSGKKPINLVVCRSGKRCRPVFMSVISPGDRLLNVLTHAQSASSFCFRNHDVTMMWSQKPSRLVTWSRYATWICSLKQAGR